MTSHLQIERAVLASAEVAAAIARAHAASERLSASICTFGTPGEGVYLGTIRKDAANLDRKLVELSRLIGEHGEGVIDEIALAEMRGDSTESGNGLWRILEVIERDAVKDFDEGSNWS